MELLIIFFILSVGISFLCSILESILLSLNISYIAVLETTNPKTGAILRYQKENINKSIASILILNTIANTLGATAVGAQASKIFGNDAVVYISVILTFAILFFSEIIPKTIGAIYWKKLAPFAAYFIRIFIWITYPMILITLFVTDKITKNKKDANSITKQELLQSMLQGEDEGIIDEKESDIIENTLNLDKIKVSEILTPRSVIFSLDENTSIKSIIDTKEDIYRFSRIPLYSGSKENITGIVLTRKIFKQALKNNKLLLKDIKKEIIKINENIPVSKALDMLISKKNHMFLVTDNYDQIEGIVTLEDCVETVLGMEIVDETDAIADMRELAKFIMKQKRKKELNDNI